MNSKRKPVFIGMLIVLVLGLAAFALSASPVFAQTAAPTTEPGQKAPAQGDAPARPIAHLEKLYKSEQKVVDHQADVLEKGANLVTRAEAIIAEFKSKGVDTSKLEAALETFVGKLENANASHDKAAAILKVHAGFDEQGKVIDRAQAAQTVKDAGQAIKETHRTIVQGRRDITKFLRDWRKEHKPEQPTN